MADDKEEDKTFHIGESYQRYRQDVDSGEDLDESFWDEASPDGGKRNSIKFKTSPTPSMDFNDNDSLSYVYNDPGRRSMNSFELKAAIAKSLDISKMIDKEEDTKTISAKLIFSWLVAIFLFLLSVGIFAFLMIHQNEESKRLAAKRRISGKIQNSNSIPLFLYAPGTSASVIPSALSSCLGLTGASLDDIENVSF